MQRTWTVTGLALVAASIYVSPALAQSAAATVNSIPQTFGQQVRGMEGPLRTMGLALLAGLVVIELSFALGFKAMEGGGLQDLLSIVVKQGIMIGLFVFLVNSGPDMARGIVTWWTNAGNTAAGGMGGSQNLSPGDVIALGSNMVVTIWDAMDWTSPKKFVVLLIAGLVMLYVFAELTCAIVEVTIKGYVFAAWSSLLMGFGGNAYTRDIAIGQIRLAMAIGAERFVLTTIVGLGETLMRRWIAQASGGNLDIRVIIPVIIGPFIMLRLAKTLPAMANGLITGANTAGSYASPTSRVLGGAASAAANTAAAMTGTGAAIGAATSLAKAQLGVGGAGGGAAGASGAGSSGSSGSAGGSGASGASGSASSGSGGSAGGASTLRVAALAARNLGAAAASDVGKRLAGDYGATHGHLGHRMAAAMREDAADIRAAAEARTEKGGNRAAA